MYKSMMIYTAFILVVVAVFYGSVAFSTGKEKVSEKLPDNYQTATFAGGCFWCVEADIEKLTGVVEVVSGYSGGKEENPSYDQVSSGKTGHREAVQVYYDPSVIGYEDLLDYFWKHFDPTDDSGSFVDRGFQYSSAIFVHNEEQRKIAEKSKENLDNSKKFEKPVITPIIDYINFYPAEDYHQNYYKVNPFRYSLYRANSGRDNFIDKIWDNEGEIITEPNNSDVKNSKYSVPSDKELKKTLTPLQYKVVRKNGTERPFDNEYWDNKKAGIYVDIVTGEPLFSSTDKYKSGTGWPSFTQPIKGIDIVEREDNTLFSRRTEVRSKHGDSHLGHLFNDGPEPTGLRYCINSASLRFVPKEDLEKEGYKEFLHLFD